MGTEILVSSIPSISNNYSVSFTIFQSHDDPLGALPEGLNLILLLILGGAT